MTEKYGELGYLNFLLWCDKKKDPNEIQKIEEKFKNILNKRISRINSKMISKSNNNKEYFDSMWRLIDILTFGETILVFRLLNKSNKIKIANQYNLKAHVLINHLENAGFIRNLSAHNSLLINIHFKTAPKEIESLKKYIFPNSRRLIIYVFIIANLVKLIDKDYDFSNLKNILDKLIKNDEEAQKYGAIDKKSIFEYIDNKK